MQNELKERAPLLSGSGVLLRRGWARHMVFDYDRRAVKSPPLRLKEWDFYQISDARYVLQLTIGHISYMSSVSANFFDLKTGEKLSVARMGFMPLGSMDMGANPEKPGIQEYEKAGLSVRFDTRSISRQLTLSAHGEREDVEISILLSNCSPDKDKMVIATPFDKARQFYLNYKENCFSAAGTVRFGEMSHTFGEGAYGLLDWGRGVWPYHQEWFWGNGSTMVEGRPFGFNVGWGFGDTSAATENMFFYDNTAYKLGRINIERQGAGYTSPVRYTDEDGLLELNAQPLFDNATSLKALIVNNSCHQVFSSYSGLFTLPDGSRHQIPPFTAFCEHSVNNW